MELVDVVTLMENLVVEYAEMVGAPLPATWEGTAFEDDPVAAQEYEDSHKAYFAACQWLESMRDSG